MIELRFKHYVLIFLAALVVFAIMEFAPSELDEKRVVLRDILGVDRIVNLELDGEKLIPESDCKIINQKESVIERARTPVVFVIHGHGDSIDTTKNLAKEIANKLDYTTVTCVNSGFNNKTEAKEWRSIAQFEILHGSTYQAVLVQLYEQGIKDFRKRGYAGKFIFVGFSMGSRTAMYTGALSDEVDYTIGIAGLETFSSLFDDSITDLVPGIRKHFKFSEISCMNKKMTWLQGNNDGAWDSGAYAKLGGLPCNNVNIVEFDGGHEIPNEEVIKLLREYK